MRYISLTLILIHLLTACAAPASTPTPSPLPPSPTPAPRTITFYTPDGAAIEGVLYGSGNTAVIFSVMGNCKRGWEDMADLVAKNGMMALTYQWRGCKPNSVDEVQIQKFLDDTRSAIDFIKAQGVSKIVLVGASLGGCASAKLALESDASGLIVIASPPSISQWGFEVDSADLNTDIPKLFITAENDGTVPVDTTRALYDLAADPKEWQTYPGSAHGTDLFETDSKVELQDRILQFIRSINAG